MNNSAKVSVIIPVFNAERYLPKALDSTIRQTYSNLEIICVDDGSTDTSHSILMEYAEKDGRIKVLKQKAESRTAALARNMGMEAATGKYLAFLDADDFFEDNAIELAVEEIERTKVEITVFNAYIYDGEKKIDKFGNGMMKEYATLHEGVMDKDEINEHILDLSTFAPWNKLYEREFIVKKGIKFRPVDPDDMEFGFLCLAEASCISIMNKRLVHYRRDASGTQTNRYIEEVEPIYLPFIYLKDELEKRGLMKCFHREFVRWFLMQFRAYTLQYKEKELFDRAYYKLKHEQYLEQFGVFELEDKELKSDILIKFREGMRCDTPEEFLFTITRVSDWILDEQCLYLPEKREKKGNYRIVLYGAGVFGKLYHEKLLKEPMVDIVCWLDRDFSRLGEDVKSPETIGDYDFDYVFVALNEESVYKEVKVFLREKSIGDEKIVWMNEYRQEG